MKRDNFNLDREFNRWFFDEHYPEMGSNRCQVYGYGNPQNSSNRDYWMKQAYKQGAEAMWQDVNAALLDYACALEGLEPEMVEPCEVYDRARASLHYYVNEQLRLFP
jgi:hypothetical protein